VAGGAPDPAELAAAATTALITFCVTPAVFRAMSALGDISKLAGVAWMTAKIVLSPRPLFVILMMSPLVSGFA
jgi:hypothetical protein